MKIFLSSTHVDYRLLLYSIGIERESQALMKIFLTKFYQYFYKT